MKDSEIQLSEFGNFMLSNKLVPEKYAQFYVMWVRKFFNTALSGDTLSEQVDFFIEDMRCAENIQDFQVQQAEKALRLYFQNFRKNTNWHSLSKSAKRPDGRFHIGDARDAMQTRLRTRRYAYRTEETYMHWLNRFFRYVMEVQGVKDSSGLVVITPEEIKNYITRLATVEGVSASTQNQAFGALLFFCRHVAGIELNDMEMGVRAKRSRRLPVVLSKNETALLLKQLDGTRRLIAELIYGAGLRISECYRLRIKDVDFDNGLVFVRDGKGGKDRSTILPVSLQPALKKHIERVRSLYDEDRSRDIAPVYLPDALGRKYPNAGREWAWYWLFPSSALSVDPRAAVVRRHHISEASIQKMVRNAARKAEIPKKVSVHTLRHTFATHLLLGGVDIRQIQEYLGHSSVETTMVYTHVVKDFRNPVASPLDQLGQEGRR